MGKLILTRGLPASGKTTRAKAWVHDAPEGSLRARVNRDDLRASLYDGAGVLPYALEQAITTVQQDTVRGLLTSGHEVVVDDMNLRAKYARAWADLAVEIGAEFEVWDLTDVPLEECVARDLARRGRGERGVSEAVIRDLHAKFLASSRLAPITPTPRDDGPACEPYVRDPSLPPAWIVDMDGTLALGRFGEPGRRGPYDWRRVGEDDPNPPVIEMVRALAVSGSDDYENTIIVMSGRDETCYEETEAWLDHYEVPCDELRMRPAGDTRKDAVVKAELFDKHVRHRYSVSGVIDDRDQVVEFWRSIGLMCAQVAPGDF